MTAPSDKTDSLSVAFADEKAERGKACGQLIPQYRDHRRLGAEVIAVDQIDAQFLGPEELMIFDIGGDVGIAALFPGVLQTVAACAAHDSQPVYRLSGVIISQA